MNIPPPKKISRAEQHSDCSLSTHEISSPARTRAPRIAAISLSLLTGGASSASAATFINTLDTFGGGEISQVISTVGSENFSTQTTEVIGGNRDSVMTVLENPFPVETSTHFDRRGSGVLSVSYGASASGNLTVEYSGIDGEGLGGYDLLADGANALGWSILYLDNPISFQVLLTDTAGNQTEGSVTTNDTVFSPEPQILFYESFTAVPATGTPEGTEFNWSSLDTASFEINLGTSTDLVVDSFATFHDDPPVVTASSNVPEPSSSLLILSAGIMMVQRRRRTKPNAATPASKSDV